MSEILLKFESLPALLVSINEDNTSTLFFELLKKNMKKQPPIFRDNAGYTKAYLKELAYQLKADLGWDWMSNDYTIEDTIKMHKEIENMLDKEKSFANVPKDTQELIHEAHFCIHAVQWHNPKFPRGNFLQLEWFNDDYTELPDDARFVFQPGFGDIILQNPYVGHPPIQCWQQNDYENITRTCQFHDRIKPGVKINLTTPPNKRFPLKKYEQWWTTNAPNFVNQHSMEKIIKYTGFPLVGKVKNKEMLDKICNHASILKLQDINCI